MSSHNSIIIDFSAIVDIEISVIRFIINTCEFKDDPEFINRINNINKNLKFARIFNPKGIIFTGGPDNVYAENSPRCAEEIFELEEVLNDSNLEVPFELKLYREVLNDKNLKNDGKLVDALCQLSSKK